MRVGEDCLVMRKKAGKLLQTVHLGAGRRLKAKRTARGICWVVVGR